MNWDLLLYPLFIISILFSGWAQFKISATYSKYSKVYTAAGRTAADIARMMLINNGISDVSIGRVSGHLTDHYHPTKRVLALSDTTCTSSSAAAIGVAAHEAGHAIQHSTGYFPIKLRSFLVPITNFASKISWLFILGGVILTAIAETVSFGDTVLLIGIGLYATTTVFQLVTLPCEFDASRRAIVALRSSGLYSASELNAAKKVLSAAAMTYVAATFASAVSLFRIILIFGRRDNRR